MRTDAVVGGAQVLLVTPFDQDGDLDEHSLAALIEFVVDAGVDGVVALGTTGEFFAMTPAEREEVMTVVTKHVRGRATVTFGVGDSSTRTAVALAQAAEAKDADCVMLQPPWYYAHSTAAVDAHLLAVATAVGIPTMLYDGGGGIRIAPATLRRLSAQAPTIRYVKVGVPDTDRVRAVVDDVPHVAPLCGDDAMMLLALRHGAIGSTVGSGNLQPATLTAIHRAMAARDLPLARRLHARELLPAVNACCVPKADYIRAYKEVLTVKGILRSPFTRPPLTPLDPIRREELLATMTSLGVI